MNDKIGWLAIIAVVQLVLVAVLMLRGGLATEAEPTLLAFDAQAADRVVIHPPTADAASSDESSDSATPEAPLTLIKRENGWQAGEFPANESKIETVLEKFAGFTSPWPVATSESASDRFEVADDAYQRRLQIYADDELLADVLLGTSPGYRRVHARSVGSDEVYSIDFNNYELPTESSEWLDKALLQPDNPPTAIALEGRWSLAQTEEGWRVWRRRRRRRRGHGPGRSLHRPTNHWRG